MAHRLNWFHGLATIGGIVAGYLGTVSGLPQRAYDFVTQKERDRQEVIFSPLEFYGDASCPSVFSNVNLNYLRSIPPIKQYLQIENYPNGYGEVSLEDVVFVQNRHIANGELPKCVDDSANLILSLYVPVEYDPFMGNTHLVMLDTKYNEINRLEIGVREVNLYSSDFTKDGKPELVVLGRDNYGGNHPGEILQIYNLESFSQPILSEWAYGSGIQIIQSNGKPYIVVPHDIIDFDRIPGTCFACPHPIEVTMYEWDDNQFVAKTGMDVPNGIRLEYALQVAESLRGTQSEEERRAIVDISKELLGSAVMDEAITIDENSSELRQLVLYTANSENPEDILPLTKNLLQTEDDILANTALDYVLQDAFFVDPETGEISPYSLLTNAYIEHRKSQGLEVVEPGVGSKVAADALIYAGSGGQGVFFAPSGFKDFLEIVIANEGHDMAESTLEPIGGPEDRTYRIKGSDTVIRLPSQETFDRFETAYDAAREGDYFTVAEVALEVADETDFDRLERVVNDSTSRVSRNLEPLNRYVNQVRGYYERNQPTIRRAWGTTEDFLRDVETTVSEIDTYSQDFDEYADRTEDYINSAQDTFDNISDDISNWLDDLFNP